MDPAKVQLSGEEIALAKNAELILTKNSIIRRVVEGFAALSEEYKVIWGDGLPVAARSLGRDGIEGREDGRDGTEAREDLRGGNAKISKGENYQGLPYVVLDYPRIFGKEDVLAIRTMFWWGHYFSVTLHLKGRYREAALPAVRAALPRLAEAGFLLAVGEDEWRHELAADNYQRIGELGAAAIDEILTGHPFLKLSAHCALDNWNEAPEILLGLFRVLAEVLRSGAAD